MRENNWKKLLRAAGVRALHAFCQTALGVIGTTAAIEKVDWIAVLSASALAAVISMLKSITIGVPEVDKNE